MDNNVFSGWGDFAYLGAIVIPFLVALICRQSWPRWSKIGLSLGLSVLTGALTIYLTKGTWEWSAPFILSIFGAAEVFYNAFFKAIFPGLLDALEKSGNADPAPTP